MNSNRDKDLKRALALSRKEGEEAEGEEEQEEEDEEEVSDEDGYSTTGWSSSEEEDEEDEQGGGGEEEDEEAREKRAAERLRVLEAAGILIRGDAPKGKAAASAAAAATSGGEEPAETLAADPLAKEEAQETEEQLLQRKRTRRGPKPERPERKGSRRPKKPQRAPPAVPPPVPASASSTSTSNIPVDGKHEAGPAVPAKDAPEVEMDDAYARYVEFTQEVSAKRPVETPTTPAASSSRHSGLFSSKRIPSLSTTSPPSSPPPAASASGAGEPSRGSGFLSTIMSMSSRRGAASPAERKATPTISGPMALGSPVPSPAPGEKPMPDRTSLISISSTSSSSQATTLATTIDSAAQPPSMTTTSWSSQLGEDNGDFLAQMPAKERKRQEAIFELIQTETTHVRDLQVIVEVFYSSLIAPQPDGQPPALTDKATTVIFANIEDVLLAAVSLLSDLETRQRESHLIVDRIGDVLQTHMERMAVYIPYCVNQSTAAQILEAERKRNESLESQLALLRTTHPKARGLDLASFLLIPMQRLTRYPLLISQIVKYTEAEEGEVAIFEQEVDSLKKSLTEAQSLLDTTNETIRLRQDHGRLHDISRKLYIGSSEGKNGSVHLDLTQPTRFMGRRRILRDEVLTKHRSGRKISVLLCSDLLLLLVEGISSSKSADGGGPTTVTRLYRMPMPLEEIVVGDAPNVAKAFSANPRDDAAFQVVHQGREKTNLRCQSARHAHLWMRDIDVARAACLAAAVSRL